jgi:hypothetical protein
MKTKDASNNLIIVLIFHLVMAIFKFTKSLNNFTPSIKPMNIDSNLSDKKISRWLKLLFFLCIPGIVCTTVILFAFKIRYSEVRPDIVRPTHIQEKNIADADNAFYILRGMGAAVHLDAYTVGLQATEEDEKNYRADPFKFETQTRKARFEVLPNFEWNTRRCDEDRQCFIAAMKEKASLKTQINQQKILLQRLHQMKQRKQYQERLFARGYDDGGEFIKHFMRAIDLSSLQAQFMIIDGEGTQGIAQLKADMNLVQNYLSNSRTLFSRLIFLSAARRQALAIQQLLDFNPQLAYQFGEDFQAMLPELKSETLSFASIRQAEQHLQSESQNADQWRNDTLKAQDLNSIFKGLVFKIQFLRKLKTERDIPSFIETSNTHAAQLKLNHFKWNSDTRELSYKETSKDMRNYIFHLPQTNKPR